MIRPTGRTYIFIVTALFLYFLANQTQVNWLFITSSLLIAIISSVFLISLTTRSSLSLQRSLHKSTQKQAIHESDHIQISLHFHNRTLQNLYHVEFIDKCPLVSASDEKYKQCIFIPTLPGLCQLIFNYDVTVYQRGLYQFSDTNQNTSFLFGLFKRSQRIRVSTSVLVYPEVKRLEKIPFLDRHLTSTITHQQSGIGSEVIGIKRYQTGDSLKHIHWRSVAKTRQLISKEFSEELHHGISLVLDRFLPTNTYIHPKHNPFEWNIKAVVSVAEYAYRNNYSIYLHTDNHGSSVSSWRTYMDKPYAVPG